MKTDIEIARETKLKNIREVAAQVGFPMMRYLIMASTLPRFLTN